jgi:LPS-assembly lipoprotein
MVHASPLRRRRFGLGLAALALTACGFRPRMPTSYGFKSIFITTASSPLLKELQRALSGQRDIEVVQDPRQRERADLQFDLLQELKEKVVIGRTAVGGVREFQLRLRVRFRVRDKAGIERIADTELLQQRDISFIETNVLAKEEEEILLYRNMQTDIVGQILLRLSHLSLNEGG